MEPDQQSGEANCRGKRQNEVIKATLLSSIVIVIILFLAPYISINKGILGK